MSGYTRQQSYIDGDVILAEHTNDEFDLLEEVFDTALGHKHDGTAAEGPTIDLISDDDDDTYVKVEATPDSDVVSITAGGTERINVDSITGVTVTGDTSITGTTALTGNLTVSGTASVTGDVTINGGTINDTSIGATTASTGDFTDVTADSIQLNGGTGSAGTLSWNNTDGTLDLDHLNGVTLQIGQEAHIYARNNSGVTINNGDAVRITGSSGTRATVGLATNVTEIGSETTIAVATETVANNSNGYFTTFGLVRDIDTSGLTEGAVIYLGVNGAITDVMPTLPAYVITIGWCVVSHAVNGSILVNINHMDQIDHLTNVNITSPADNDFLSYNSATLSWENTKEANFTSGAINGVTVGATTPSTGNFTSLTVSGTDVVVDTDIGTTVQAYDVDTAKYDDVTANFTGTLQNAGSNVLVDSDLGSTVQAYDIDTAKYDAVTANFTGTLQNGGSNVLVDSDLGSTVQAYDVDTAKYDATTANFTGTLQNGGSNVVVDTDIGTTVQAYDADTAKYDDTTANFTGTLQNGGSNVLVDTDIGSTVQSYDVDTAKLDVDQSWTGSQRGSITTDNDLSFDMNAANNFACTPTGTGTLTFTNITSGQSGHILLTNGSNYAISAAATTKITAADLTTISTTGIYKLHYLSNGTNVYVTVSGDLT